MTAAVDPGLIPAEQVPGSALREALEVCAAGSMQETAAVLLLLEDRLWLGRPDFLRCVEVEEQGWTPDGPAILAEVDWYAAGLLATHAEATCTADAVDVAVLRLAASLAAGDLGAALTGLPPHDLDVVLPQLVRAITGGAR